MGWNNRLRRPRIASLPNSKAPIANQSVNLDKMKMPGLRGQNIRGERRPR